MEKVLELLLHSGEIDKLLEALRVRGTEQKYKALCSCIGGEKVALVRRLVAAFGTPDLRWPESGLTLLQQAAELGSVESAKVLLDAGADPELTGPSGWTALHYAVDSEADRAHQAGREAEPQVSRVLIEAGADPTSQTDDRESAIAMARAYGFHAFLELVHHTSNDPES